MRAGELRHYADIENLTQTLTGGRGNPLPPVANKLYSDVPMHIEPLTGKQLEITRQLVATASHRVTLRYLPGITAGMRLNYIGRYFNVEWVNEGDFKQHDMMLIVTEQTTGSV